MGGLLQIALKVTQYELGKFEMAGLT